MRPVPADFAPRGVPGRWAWMALALIVALTAFAAVMLVRKRLALEGQRAALKAVIAQNSAAALAAPAPLAAPPYAASAREMLVEHRSPWVKVLTALEATAMVGVTPLTVEVASSDASVRVEVNFTDHARLIEYLDALNAGHGDLQWGLVQTQTQASNSVAVLHARLLR